jgi:hypothetical protein
MKPWWYKPTVEHPYELEDVQEWTRLASPILWRGFWIVADRHLPDGIRQHLVRGEVPYGFVVNNAHIIGEKSINE